VAARLRTSVADEALVRAVFEEHGRALLAYATRLLGDRQAAEDVVQETLVRAWRHPEALVNGKGSVRSWLLAVTRHLVLDRVRAAAAQPREMVETPAATPAVTDHAEDVMEPTVMMDGLGRLSEEHQAVLTELYVKGSSVAEAAAALGVPPETVCSRCYYALRSLRDHLGPGPLLEDASR